MNARLKAYIERMVPDIDRELFRFLPEDDPGEFLYAPMRDYPIRGGKRFRSVLVLLGCEALGGDPSKAMLTAAAFEMFQSFALVHDDIEDGSEMRRGKPCLHRIHGIPLAINVGDALFANVYELLVANRDVLGENVTLDLVSEMNDGARKTFEGQAYDIGWVESDTIPTVEAFINMLRLKTGWYSGRGPCTAGAIIAGASDAQREAIGSFGETMAVAFQIRDDLLNLTVSDSDAVEAPTGTAGGYGKERGGDIAEGKRTLMVIDLLEHANGDDRKRVLSILGKLREDVSHAEIEEVIDLMTQYGSIDRTQETCFSYAREAEGHLEMLPDMEARETLREMCSFLVERVF